MVTPVHIKSLEERLRINQSLKFICYKEDKNNLPKFEEMKKHRKKRMCHESMRLELKVGGQNKHFFYENELSFLRGVRISR